jgi:hypothetical protein
VKSCEESWSNIPQEQWGHKFINTLDTTLINWYLQAELHLITVDWEGMNQNFVTAFLFEIQYPTVDQVLQIVRQKIFEETPTSLWSKKRTNGLCLFRNGCYNINADEDDDPRKVNIAKK